MREPGDRLKLLRDFLRRAADDEEFREELEKRMAASPSKSEVLREFGFEIEEGELPTTWKLPSRDLCRELYVWTEWVEEYTEGGTDPRTYAVERVVHNATPLVVTVSDEVAAAA